MRRLLTVTLAIMLMVSFNAAATVIGQKDIYSIKELSATVKIPDGYDVFSKDNPVSDEVFKRHNIDRVQYEKYISMVFKDLWMIPVNDNYPASFTIYVKVKQKDVYIQIGDLRKWPKDDLSELVDAFLQNTGADGYEYYETKSALFYKADWFVNGHPEQRYASIVDGQMLYIFSRREDGPLTEKDRKDLKYVVDHFVIEQPISATDSNTKNTGIASNSQSGPAFAALKALSKTTVWAGLTLALFAVVAAISFRSSRKTKQPKNEIDNKEKK